jgi:hypothetical protein
MVDEEPRVAFLERLGERPGGDLLVETPGEWVADRRAGVEHRRVAGEHRVGVGRGRAQREVGVGQGRLAPLHVRQR